MTHSSSDNISIPFPKPPSPEPYSLSQQPGPAPVGIDDILVVTPSSDPPPPYRAPRRARGGTRSSRRTLQASEDSVQSLPTLSHAAEAEGATETTPLLRGRARTLSHSSTAHSVNSLAQTVISSSRTVISLFQTEEDDVGGDTISMTDLPFRDRAKRYFRPLVKRKYYASLFHLFVLNLPYEIVVWVYLFVGTVTGTTLLITLPLGVILCFINLIGARIFARGEIALQTKFHGPLSVLPPHPPHPIFSRYRPPPRQTDSILENNPISYTPIPETSFLRLTYLMFTDPKSYQALFYFLVIKPGLTLLIFIAIAVLVPTAFVLILPAPAVLRAVRRVGIWQADVAIDALS